MRFRITPHRGARASPPPDDAMALLWQRLGPNRDDMSFYKVGNEIRVEWGDDPPPSMGQDERAERAERGRGEILDLVMEVCQRAPDVNSDWFAVSAQVM